MKFKLHDKVLVVEGILRGVLGRVKAISPRTGNITIIIDLGVGAYKRDDTVQLSQWQLKKIP